MARWILIKPDGTKIWFLNGAIHRDDGPAITRTFAHDGYAEREWYYHGTRLEFWGKTLEEAQAEIELQKIMES